MTPLLNVMLSPMIWNDPMIECRLGYALMTEFSFSSAADHVGAVQQGAGCNRKVLWSCHLQETIARALPVHGKTSSLLVGH
jgi:hypothetical protein